MHTDKALRLHLGCGTVHLPGWVNIDWRYQPGVDKIDNIGILKSYQPGTVNEIYACHVLDYFSRWEYAQVLARWHELLATDGKLRISIPDFGAIVQRYQATGDLRPLTGLLYAAQEYPGDIRHIMFDYTMLRADLQDAGFAFRYIKKYDWQKTDHAHIDDYSQAYLPHMDKENGLLMSLNVEATK